MVCLDGGGITDFDIPHSRWTADPIAIGLTFDLLMFDGNDLRRQPLRDRKSALAKLLIRSRGGIQYVEHAEGCLQAAEGIVSKRLASVYKSGPSRTLIKVKTLVARRYSRD